MGKLCSMFARPVVALTNKSGVPRGSFGIVNEVSDFQGRNLTVTWFVRWKVEPNEYGEVYEVSPAKTITYDESVVGPGGLLNLVDTEDE